MIFAREVSDNLTGLVKKVNKATADNARSRMGSFVVFCNDDEKLETQLKELANKEKINKTILTIVGKKSGPSGYSLDPKADVTVVLYVKKTVKANYAFKKGELKEKDIKAILDDIPKILKK